MQLVRYLTSTGAEIGVHEKNRVVGARVALRRFAQLDGRQGPFIAAFRRAAVRTKDLQCPPPASHDPT